MATNPYSAGSSKAAGEMAPPVKQPPVGGGRGPQAPGLGGGPATPRLQSASPAGPQLDEFGRDTSAFLGSTKTPMAAVPDFNQRKANAAMMMPSAAPSAPQSTPYGQTGGGFMYPGPPQQTDPPQGGPGRMPPQQFPQQRGPMPYDPQGGFGNGAGQGAMRGQQPGLQPPGAMGGQGGGQAGGPMGPPPGFQQMLQQPGFMQWLMKMFQGQQGGGQQPALGGVPAPGAPPAQQAGPMTQGPPL